ncbi:MAG TPA: hypothetical protein VJ203_01750 [Bacteroidales bacterium]|nr:hypothetical protein [Bacteroidales bacterium]
MKSRIGLPKRIETINNIQLNSCEWICCSKVNLLLSCLLIIVLFPPRMYGIDVAKGSERGVFEAYELRINGETEKAEALLDEILKEDSTDALAYFELARTKHHEFLGGTQFSAEEWKEVMHALQKAVRYAPDNEIFAFYYAYSCFFNAFISMMRQQPDVGEKVTLTCDAFKNVLKLNPDCHEAQLYMIDIFNYLPAEMGGDKEKAGIIAAELNTRDELYGAMADARLLPENSDFVMYWQNIEKEAGHNAQLMEELGRAYLLKSDTENGTKYFQDAIRADITRRYLYMHLVRYHILSIQQDPDAKAAHLGKAIELTNSYMQSTPEILAPLKAYAYGILSLIKMIGGEESSSNEYREMATALDPYYSKAMGMPSSMLYCPPDEVKIQYSSFFMPF